MDFCRYENIDSFYKNILFERHLLQVSYPGLLDAPRVIIKDHIRKLLQFSLQTSTVPLQQLNFVLFLFFFSFLKTKGKETRPRFNSTLINYLIFWKINLI